MRAPWKWRLSECPAIAGRTRTGLCALSIGKPGLGRSQVDGAKVCRRLPRSGEARDDRGLRVTGGLGPANRLAIEDVAEQGRPIADDEKGAVVAEASTGRRHQDLGLREWTQRLIETLDVEVASLRVQGDQKPAAFQFRRGDPVGDRLEGRHAHHRQAAGQCDAVRRGQPDAKPGEGTGPKRRRQTIKACEGHGRLGQHLLDEAEQRLRLAALHFPKARRKDPVILEKGGRAGASGGVEGKNLHRPVQRVAKDKVAGEILAQDGPKACKNRTDPGKLVQAMDDRPKTPLIEITARDGVALSLAYATAANFTGKPIYAHARCYLHPDAALLLHDAVAIAERFGHRLKIFDGFRPAEAQQILWDACPNPEFLADPKKGSPHSRGVAIDLTLADRTGKELDMGTPFDAFTPLSHHGNGEIALDVSRNRLFLLGLMTDAGWDFYRNEWWHYQLFDAKRYPLLHEADLGLGMLGLRT